MRHAFLAAVTLLGCGARSSLQAEGGAGTPASTDGDGGDAAAVSPVSCRFDAPQPSVRVALAVVSGVDLVYVLTDGSTTTPYHFPATVPGPGGPAFTNGIDQWGGYVLAYATWWGPSPDGTCQESNGLLSCPEDDRVVLLDPAGRTVWEKRFSASTSSSATGLAPHVGAGGYVLLRSAPSLPDRLLIAPDGSEQQLPQGWTAFERPYAGPVVPVFDPLDRDVFGWWRPGSDVTTTDFSIQGSPYIPDSGLELDFPATARDGSPLIVHARPDGGGATLPTQADVLHGGAAFSSGAWRVEDQIDRIARFSVVTGESSVLSWATPAGMRRFVPAPATAPAWSDTTPTFAAEVPLSTGIDHGGSFLAVFRDDYRATAFRSADAATWVPIGRTLGQVEQVSVGELAGTYLIDAQGTNEVFSSQQTWQTAAPGHEPELLQGSHQIVRPSDGVASVVHLGSAEEEVHVSRDGLCAGYWAGSPDGSLTVQDIVRGSTFPVRLPISAFHALVWME